MMLYWPPRSNFHNNRKWITELHGLENVFLYFYEFIIDRFIVFDSSIPQKLMKGNYFSESGLIGDKANNGRIIFV